MVAVADCRVLRFPLPRHRPAEPQTAQQPVRLRAECSVLRPPAAAEQELAVWQQPVPAPGWPGQSPALPPSDPNGRRQPRRPRA